MGPYQKKQNLQARCLFRFALRKLYTDIQSYKFTSINMRRSVCSTINVVTFEVTPPVSVNSNVFCEVKPSSVAEVYQSFRET